MAIPWIPVGNQIVDDTLLLGGGAFAGQFEFDGHISEFTVGLFDTFAGDGPEIGGIIGYEGEFEILGG